jgi:SAM-dependent methyltransferase
MNDRSDPAIGTVPLADGQAGSNDTTWYNRFYASTSNSELVIPPEILVRYEKLPHPELNRLEMWHRLIGDIKGKKVLFVGCGVETSPVLLALRGGAIWVLDVAEEAIKRQKSLAMANGTETRTRFLVGSCRQLPVGSGMFDLVVGIGILHHLQEVLDETCIELTRVLKKDGFAVFEEPIALSSVVKVVRDCLPVPALRDASPVCRPLDKMSMACLQRHFSQQLWCFAFLARFDRLLYAGQPSEFAPWWKNCISRCMHLFDYFLFRIPGLRTSLASQIVVKLTPLGPGPS